MSTSNMKLGSLIIFIYNLPTSAGVSFTLTILFYSSFKITAGLLRLNAIRTFQGFPHSTNFHIHAGRSYRSGKHFCWIFGIRKNSLKLSLMCVDLDLRLTKLLLQIKTNPKLCFLRYFLIKTFLSNTLLNLLIVHGCCPELFTRNFQSTISFDAM